ncbi:MAG: HDOD domain-containing protein [Thermodesulfobacteriota bacterium]
MEVYVARQPVFRKNRKVYGYELLFRDGISNCFPSIDGDLATSKILSNAFLSIGIEEITGGAPAFINFTEKLLVERVPLLLSPGLVLVEILEDIKPTPDLLQACREMQEKGFTLVLDDFTYRPDLQDLIALSKIVKLDFRATDPEELKWSVRKLAAYPVSLLAEKVETHEEVEKADQMGFSLFQGYFFSRPEVLVGRDISSSQMALMQIMAEANKEEVEFRKLEAVMGRDVAISYKLMRYVNSAFFRRVNQISSIKQAIIMLGERQIRQFISLIAMSQLSSDKPSELIRSSIVRAKFCELLGSSNGNSIDASELFTLGLFSMIDAILDKPMEEIMERLPLSAPMKEALVDGKGRLSDYLSLSISYERGEWERASSTANNLGLAFEVLPGCFKDALGWANAFAGL